MTARPWVSAAVAVVLIGAGVGTYVLVGRSSPSTAATASTTRLTSASVGNVSEAVSATGTLSPADEYDVSFSAAAKITSVRVAQGQQVAKGQVLGTIDTVSLKATLAQARATLAAAESTLATASDSSSTTTAQLAADRTNVTSARSSVTDAEQAVAGATLRSPIAATVAQVNATLGATSSGSGTSSTTSTTSTATSGSTGSRSGSTGTTGSATGGSTSGGTSGTGSSGATSNSSSSSASSSTGDFVVVGMKAWTVSASLDDTEVGLVAKGDQVRLSTDNVTGTVFGVVSAVSVLSSTSSGSASYPVTIAVTGSPAGLHDGASVTASIIYKQLNNVLTVPTAAVHRTGSSSYVDVSRNGKQTKTTVTTGLASGGVTQIKSGLTSGAQVVEQIRTPAAGGSTSRRSGGNTQTGTFPGGGYGGGGGNFPGGGTGNFPGSGRNQGGR